MLNKKIFLIPLLLFVSIFTTSCIGSNEDDDVKEIIPVEGSIKTIFIDDKSATIEVEINNIEVLSPIDNSQNLVLRDSSFNLVEEYLFSTKDFEDNTLAFEIDDLESYTDYNLNLNLISTNLIENKIKNYSFKTNASNILFDVSAKDITHNSFKLMADVIDNANILEEGIFDIDIFNDNGESVFKTDTDDEDTITKLPFSIAQLKHGVDFKNFPADSTFNVIIEVPDSLKMYLKDVNFTFKTATLEEYLKSGSFLITQYDSSNQGQVYGSGFLFDISEDYVYVGTNAHVVEDYDISLGDQLCISNNYEKYHEDYDIKTADNKIINNDITHITNYITNFVYSDCVKAEIVYELDRENDELDFAVIRVKRQELDIAEDITPFEFVDVDYISMKGETMYNYSNGRGRWGSYFDNVIYIKESEQTSLAWSENVYISGEFEPFALGEGSSGSIVLNKYGKAVFVPTAIKTWTGIDGNALEITEDNYGTEVQTGPDSTITLHSISGIDFNAINDVLIPDYISVLTEKTYRNP